MKPYYQDELVTLYHGDCREVLATMSDSSVDSVVTDPPFKLSQAYSASVDSDNLDAVASIIECAPALLRVAKPGAVAAVAYDNRIMPFGLDAFRRCGWSYLRFLTLYRRWGNAHQMAGWMSTSDPILVFAKPGAKVTYYGRWSHDVYVRDRPEPESFGHPAQKPAFLMESIVGRVTPPNGVVLDPFAGSGSTLAAAKRLNLRAVGVELSESYCETVATRLSGAFIPAEDSLFGGVA